jgi:hypothetical protein
MTVSFDIFKSDGDKSVIWIEAVEDIVAAKKRMLTLASSDPGEYKLWDSSKEQFINPMDDWA